MCALIRLLDNGRQEEEGEEALSPVKPMKDLSIAEGQKLHIGLKVRASDGRDYILLQVIRSGLMRAQHSSVIKG